MPTGAKQQRIAILHQVFSLPCQVREINYLEGKVMHLDRACFCERQAMMISVAAHPEEDVVYPVRNAETEYLAVELGTALAIIHE